MTRLLLLSLTVVSITSASVSAQSFPAVQQRMRQAVGRARISGAVTLVAHRGKIVHLDAVGRRRLDSDQPMAKDTMFAIASMTKPISATALMILQDEGRLSIDDPVAKYVPAFAKAALKSGEAQPDITLRHLLTHTSGLTGSQRVMGSLQQHADELAGRPLRFKAGTRWGYSPGLNVCARVVEVVSKHPFDIFVNERIFQPLKMKDTTFAPSTAQKQRLAQLCRPGKDKQSIVPAEHWINDLSEKRAPNPSGGLFSTASDMARFYQMILNRGELDGRRIVSAAAVKKMTTLQTADLKTGFTPGNGWGLGWCIVRQPQGVSAMLAPGSFGHGGAFGTQGWVDPKNRTIFVLMIQRTGFGNSDAADLRRDFQHRAVEAISNLR